MGKRTEPMRILALGAHPDDIEAGCCGTLIKYAENGHRIFLMVMTQGGQGGAIGVRTREQARAARLLQAEKVFWGGYSSYFADPDGNCWEVAYNPLFPFDELGNLKLE